MPERKLTFVWDMDGTLIDSYAVITGSIRDALAASGISLSYEEIHKAIIDTSAGRFLTECAEKYSLDRVALKEACGKLSESRILEIPAMPHAAELLQTLCAAGHTNHVITHRGLTTYPIIENLQLGGYLTEIIHAESGFSRKPDPGSMHYLIEKYVLRREDVYYVGDRNLDMEFARNAGVGGIMYLPPENIASPSGLESFLIRDFTELLALPIF